MYTKVYTSPYTIMANIKLIEKVVVSARISDEFNGLLEAYAKMFGCDRSELVKEAIARYLNHMKETHGLPANYRKE